MRATIALWIFIIVLMNDKVKGSPPPSSSSSSSSSSSINTSSRNSNMNSLGSPRNNSNSNSGVVEVLEEEYWNGELWVGSDGGRWKNPTSSGSNELSLPPNELTAPMGWQFTSDWKIDVTGQSRDNLGWEYLSNGTTRTRRWLRTIGPISTTTATSSSSGSGRSKASVTAMSKKRRSSSSLLVSSWWNFKGYGCSVMKSLIRKKQVSLVLRTPLTTNLDWLERRPYLPTLTSSLSISYPLGMISLSCNTSIPVELLKYLAKTLMDYLLYTVSILQYIFAQLFLYQLIYQSIRTLYQLLFQSITSTTTATSSTGTAGIYTFPDRPYQRPFVTSTDITERVGVSFTWRHSSKYGYERIIYPWHVCLPTLEYTNQLLTNLCWNAPQQLYRKLISSKDKNNKQNKQDNNNDNNNIHDSSSQPSLLVLSNWLRRYTASLGIHWGGPTPDPPFYTANCMFSLSGIYPKLIRNTFYSNNHNNNNNDSTKSLQNNHNDNTSHSQQQQQQEQKLPQRLKQSSDNEDEEDELNTAKYNVTTLI